MFLRRLLIRMVFIALLAMTTTAFGLILYDRLRPPPERRPGQSPSDSGLAVNPSPPRSGAAPQGVGPAPQPTATAGPQSPPAGVDPAKQAAFRQAMVAARAAVGKRDFAGAKGHLATAKASIQGPANRRELERLDTMIGNLEEFWRGMAAIVGRLEPAEEIMLGETPIIVVGVDGNELTVRSEGRNATYRLHDLPRPIVEALAQRGFAKHPSSLVLLGTYMFLDPNGDRRRARQLWEEAGRQGEDVRELREMMNEE